MIPLELAFFGCPIRFEELGCILEPEHNGCQFSGAEHFTHEMNPPARRGRGKRGG